MVAEAKIIVRLQMDDKRAGAPDGPTGDGGTAPGRKPGPKRDFKKWFDDVWKREWEKQEREEKKKRLAHLRAMRALGRRIDSASGLVGGLNTNPVRAASRLGGMGVQAAAGWAMKKAPALIPVAAGAVAVGVSAELFRNIFPLVNGMITEGFEKFKNALTEEDADDWGITKDLKGWVADGLSNVARGSQIAGNTIVDVLNTAHAGVGSALNAAIMTADTAGAFAKVSAIHGGPTTTASDFNGFLPGIAGWNAVRYGRKKTELDIETQLKTTYGKWVAKMFEQSLVR